MDATTKFILALAYPDLVFDDWITIKGAHVETDESGNLKGAVGQKIAESKKAPTVEQMMAEIQENKNKRLAAKKEKAASLPRSQEAEYIKNVLTAQTERYKAMIPKKEELLLKAQRHLFQVKGTSLEKEAKKAIKGIESDIGAIKRRIANRPEDEY